jgi:hypothetical protein
MIANNARRYTILNTWYTYPTPPLCRKPTPCSARVEPREQLHSFGYATIRRPTQWQRETVLRVRTHPPATTITFRGTEEESGRCTISREQLRTG